MFRGLVSWSGLALLPVEALIGWFPVGLLCLLVSVLVRVTAGPGGASPCGWRTGTLLNCGYGRAVGQRVDYGA